MLDMPVLHSSQEAQLLEVVKGMIQLALIMAWLVVAQTDCLENGAEPVLQ